jgi:hypothetical protein
MKKVDCLKNNPKLSVSDSVCVSVDGTGGQRGMLRCTVYLCICARVEILSAVSTV